MSEKQVHIICNTHWDREHRHNFQETRMMLVELIDTLIERFATDPDFHTFIFDGQTVVLDDYLEVKPYNRPILEKLVKEGRIQVGPWYTLPDHTPANPESIIRNLLYGRETALGFGRRMNIGFSIFSFGQPGQLPQIYDNFGIRELIFYKGAPLDEIPDNEFFWEAPDGTRLLASRLGDWFRCNFFVYFTVPVLLGGDMNRYGGWKCSFADKRKLTIGADDRTFSQFAAEIEPDIRIREENIEKGVKDVLHSVRESKSDNVKLVFDGIDFSTPVKEITQAIAIANEKYRGSANFRISDLEKYFEAFRRDADITDLHVLKGEMRYGPIESIHSEVVSSNTPVKQEVARIENKLLSHIEPFATFMQGFGSEYPHDFSRLAWTNIFKVQAHDSFHGAGDKALVGNSMAILSQTSDLCDSLAKRGFENIIRQMDTSDLDSDEILITIFNPLPHPYSGIIRVHVAIPQEDNSKRISFHDPDGNELESYTYCKEDRVLGCINPENRPKAVFVRRFTSDVYVSDVPPVGYTTLTVKRDKNPTPEVNPFGEPYFPYSPIVFPDGKLNNGQVEVSVNPDCTITVRDLVNGHIIERTHILRDQGEAGNVWVHNPPQENRIVMPLAVNATVSIVENSFLRGTVRVNYLINLPASLNEGRNAREARTEPVRISTEITLLKNDRNIYFRTAVENTVRDHKLSVCFPTGIKACISVSDSIFELVERPIDYRTDNKGRTSKELLRHPMQRFVDLSDGEKGVALMSRGIHEYETYELPDGAAVELTLLRSVTQRFPVHADVFVDFDRHPSQSQGTRAFEYSLALHDGDHRTGSLQQTAAEYTVSQVVYQHAPGTKGKHLPASGYSFFSKTNPCVNLHCIKPSEDKEGIIFRFCNPAGKKQTETVTLHRNITEAYICRADETVELPVNSTANKVVLDIDPYKIVTLKVKLA